MDNDKPSYELLEQELNEYKELLWQLSDEYRTNVGNIEKKLLDQTTLIKALENKAEAGSPEQKFSFINSLGLPACLLDDDGKLLKYNNKFKFLIELLGLEIEEISNISVLLSKNKTENLSEKLQNYFKNDDGVFQNLFKVENSFQGIINLILRIYKYDSGNEHLALFIELHKLEIKGLDTGDSKNSVGELKHEITQKTGENEEIIQLKSEITVFAEKYEVYSEILKLFVEPENQNSLTSESLQQNITQKFSLEHTRNKIIEKLTGHYKEFILLIRSKYPDLTTNEEKHCMLIRAGLTYKEISSIMDISINGVKIARNRLRKKLELENDTKTSVFIDNVE